jgi:tRNA U34 5-methylaminomethyl-2-thiouridine-forming methyltransferase MnmC
MTEQSKGQVGIDQSSSPHVQETADGSRTLFSEAYDQTYHSHHGAEAESLHVFFEISGLREALESERKLKILEIGYGTALNTLLLGTFAEQSNAAIGFVTTEKARLSAEDYSSLDYQSLESVSDSFYDRWKRFEEAGDTVLTFNEFELTLLEGDVTVTDWESRGPYDFVWHDAFSPDANAELWSDEFLKRLYDSLAPGGVMTTYTVKGTVRRACLRVGFEIEKVPGPPNGKREVLVARKAPWKRQV